VLPTNLPFLFLLVLLLHVCCCAQQTAAGNRTQPAPAGSAQTWPEARLNSLVAREFLLAALAYETNYPLAKRLRKSCAQPAPAAPLRILLLGDSVSRYMTTDACSAWNGTLVLRCLPSIHYGSGERDGGSGCCALPWGSLTFVHLFGSSSHAGATQKNVKAATTSVRVPLALKEFRALYGAAPDVVVFRSDMWDVAALPTKHLSAAQKRAALNAVREAYSAVIAVTREAAPAALLATHTTPQPADGWAFKKNARLEMFEPMEDAIRLVAADLRLVLFDWRVLTTGKATGEYLRDDHHPKPAFCNAFTEALVAVATSWVRCRADPGWPSPVE
jgi:hypothetical protein